MSAGLSALPGRRGAINGEWLDKRSREFERATLWLSRLDWPKPLGGPVDILRIPQCAARVQIRGGFLEPLEFGRAGEPVAFCRCS